MSRERQFLLFLLFLALTISVCFRLTHKPDLILVAVERAASRGTGLDLRAWSADEIRDAVLKRKERALALAGRLALHKNTAGARSLVLIAAENDPFNSSILECLAGLYLAERDLPQARATLSIIQKRGLRLSETGIRLAVSVALQSRDLVGAEKALARLLTLRPNDTEALAQLGSLRLMEGNFPAAESAYRKIISVDGDNADAHLFLARTLSWQVMREAQSLARGSLGQISHE